MKILVNDDASHVEKVRTAIRNRDGHCPCAIITSDDTLCMCKDFREQIADPEFDGYCHCKLYYKEK